MIGNQVMSILENLRGQIRKSALKLKITKIYLNTKCTLRRNKLVQRFNKQNFWILGIHY